MHDALESLSLSSTSSRTLTLQDIPNHQDDDTISTISDWTDAFETQSQTESELQSGDDFDSESDVVSDAESDASWARVRSRGVGVH